MSGTKKRVFIKTFGCQMNVYDSAQMATLLGSEGYDEVGEAEDADLVVLNTCHIREKAAEKVYSDLGRLRQIKEARAKDGKTTQIAVAGCVAQAEGAEIQRRAPVVDYVVGPQSYQRLPQMLRGEEGPLATDFAVDDKFERLAKKRAANGPTAFVTVQEGCDKFCSFCVVPYTRGAEHSRSAQEISTEVRTLVRYGVREVTLLGQNVNAWAAPGLDGDTDWGLGELIAHLAQIDGLARIRYTTSHPRDMDDGLIAAHRDIEVLMPYLHLPVQSGSDGVLKAMNRGHTMDMYYRLIDKIRAARPDIALSGDFIVGYPGESDADFEDTLKAVRDIGYASAYSFKYSRRPGTPGAKRDDQVPEDVKADRLRVLQDLLVSQQIAFNESLIGKTLPVLFDKKGRHEGQICGRSPYLQSVYVQGSPHLIGTLVDVKITTSGRNALSGNLVSEAMSPA
ncbi:MAG: tRNA (N6-isopentenyl adenosine(37)-C2)-methylthiotransferase MiaB [Robiginitomaculum sp.]|nr:tRNA (N6-isopentenyl adenosine(37)-C2)-methylthiotransferase MiaB [Robiginitomaculum sp.]MDQ7078725.1 tRNA (N6-isopentenyl adenosine(37)-C2)-methylthiotransferase MiaB [Robiginitomaculum sp.]